MVLGTLQVQGGVGHEEQHVREVGAKDAVRSGPESRWMGTSARQAAHFEAAPLAAAAALLAAPLTRLTALDSRLLAAKGGAWSSGGWATD